MACEKHSSKWLDVQRVPEFRSPNREIIFISAPFLGPVVSSTGTIISLVASS